jgi:hypothetical protein
MATASRSAGVPGRGAAPIWIATSFTFTMIRARLTRAPLESVEAAELGGQATMRRCKPGRVVRTGDGPYAHPSGGAVAIGGEEGTFHEFESKIGEGAP